ncbi:MAG: hypothetical protein AMK72_07270 [Planctomycetes bacterium SM23_25]|nr:MAG: hypothetical protein AMK72_07270 [Planctomycetes bacterium SM23_25]
MERLTLLACCAVALAWVAGCEPEARRTGSEVAQSLTPVRFQAAIYEVRLKADRLAHLDAERLAAKAGTGVDFEKTLADMGEARALYRVDQMVNLTDDRIHIGKREPFVATTRASRDGNVVSMIQYEHVGVLFGFSGRLTEQGPDVKLDIEMSSLTDSATEVSGGVKAVTTRKAVLGRNGPIRLGRPEVLVSADASAEGADGDVLAYVCRIVFSEVGS